MAAVFCFSISSTAQQSGTSTMLLKIMTYNVRHCSGMDNAVNYTRTKNVIEEQDPDVVALQEIDSMATRTSKVDQMKTLSNMLGMYATFGPAIPLQGGKYGVGILSKEKPISVRNVPLPGSEKRTLLICEFEHYVFACTHLDLTESERLASVPIINAEAEKWDKPFIIAGDWNDTPTSKSILSIRKTFYLLNTTTTSASYSFPADVPNICIDYIASYKKKLDVKRTWVVNAPTQSDHRPVRVDANITYEVDGIHQPFAKLEESPIFTIDGRCISRSGQTATLPKGIYIKKGKKLLVK